MTKGTLLIVDDSVSILKFLANTFQEAGYTVHTASNGQKGWEALQTDGIDLIISDLEMPVMTGMELCDKVKQHNIFKHIYFIILSTRGEAEIKVDSLTIGADDYVTKSTPRDEIIARVDAGLRIRQLQKELETHQSKLYQQEKMASIGQLAAGVAHEINNPIGFVSSNLGTLAKYVLRFEQYIQALHELPNNDLPEQLHDLRKELKIDFITEDAKDLISESREGTERVTKIVQGLKDFTRIDEAESKPIAINECIDNTINILPPKFRDNVTIVKNYNDLPTTVCYAQLINQVFLNVLTNAAQAYESSGEIIIKTWAKDNTISITFSDTGCGIAKENINKIFEPFFTTKDVGSGVGLGLSIAYDIIRKHNGHISAESKLGKGTTISIKIPFQAP